ncbi:CDP-glycerol glycerophosphotransferase family protein, partial [Pseudomonas aeruginosa]
LLVGMRHGSVTRYGFAEGTYRYADYLCGSAWDIDDTLASSVMPRNGFLLTGNAWCDEVFRLPARTPAENAPTILFAPTYNPEISAAVHLGERVVALIRKVYPASRIIIKPHPAIVQHEHAFVSDKDLFRDLMKLWREQSRTDPLVTLVDDPEASIAASFAEADILLADRSSLIFEFMTLDRPILLFS